jgi:hypothetical protein
MVIEYEMVFMDYNWILIILSILCLIMRLLFNLMVCIFGVNGLWTVSFFYEELLEIGLYIFFLENYID